MPHGGGAFLGRTHGLWQGYQDVLREIRNVYLARAAPGILVVWLFTFIASAVGELNDKAVGSPIVSPIISLVLVLPNLAILARRLHDIDRTSWWLLPYFVP